MATNTVVPALLVEMEAEFSAQLRARTPIGGTCSSGMSLYRKIIRDNIGGVLRSVFPLFCRCLNEAEIRELVEVYLSRHSASQPEFHQVATELLLFMSQHYPISPHDLALLEYEWLMYAVEIDDSNVPFPQKISLPLGKAAEVDVACNPTLKMVALPFLIQEGEPCYEDGEQLNYYALYRKHNNTLYQKQLSQLDVQLLSAIHEQIISAEQMLNNAALSLADISLRSWLETNNNDEILSLKYIG
ncbi:putative DNA-binding domain-containing protein [Citrobacter portucalensis]|uniref:DNA-binding domain-containing protein n=1 Tax=Citrobacter portucalensis TaxID=1639133 RepID=A0AAW5W6L6_9ENTR|nr:putative DNA-binding domain-containing protein [Citrobacter portucalensis]MCX9000434.1 putative DNA-binding domain-containing protein [Citrobacter portucalensis]